MQAGTRANSCGACPIDAGYHDKPPTPALVETATILGHGSAGSDTPVPKLLSQNGYGLLYYKLLYYYIITLYYYYMIVLLHYNLTLSYYIIILYYIVTLLHY